ncbi:hypothetical protein GCK72_002930 [Caenorhabditis remanei]|uniref:BTB domain-containing protein n=1 Tax=Caenorhabditis remanei TaxID=31234 RepID=A0A6A5HU49_CAERE|nr:hypothetical protein GCK72_002930 [Caenorhabditis remanei]KAF1771105.1 hypothetical protein GCK72_002930 [Caenorhabditis remanei]
MMPHKFVTVHQYSLINWQIEISESGLPGFIRNIIDPDRRDQSVFQLVLQTAGLREKCPPVRSIEFKIRVVDIGDKEIMSPIRYVHPPGFPSRHIFNSSYSTPERGPVQEFLQSVIGVKLLENFDLDIQTLIVFDVKDFLSMENLNLSIGNPMPVELNFRYNLLMNQKFHNFHLITTTGQGFPCNKEALFVASPYFRKNLTAEMTHFQLRARHLEAIEVAITWMLTETYHPPPIMTPELADEIVKLTLIVGRGPNQRKLLGSIERHCYEELVKNHEDLEYVKNVLLVAHNNRLGSLQEASHACIITYHFADFQRDMIQNPSPEFTANGAFHQQSVLRGVRDNYTRGLLVKSFTRKTSQKSN